ncbi:muscle-specific protein 20 isoform X2 [Exaiptasia diaphana]|uniref:Calponin-homology (CH) domain-containing protein n=1 Tax=Exaiptasia diaphana TaxID=2652724 RepID=A0A913Y7K3_EXADI|nr:muscle-specific protein 20 isoform X2 [Exaiptasia diaphana]
MAFRPAKHGFSAEATTKIAAKYPKEWEADAMAWVANMSGQSVEWGTGDEARLGDNFAKPLTDGVILCHVVNNLFPNSVKKVHDQNPNAFKMQENISNFLKACEANGVDRVHIFQTVDLYEKQNVGQVISCLQALSRVANKKDPSKPLFGPKQADECKREFTEEQLKEAAKKAH